MYFGKNLKHLRTQKNLKQKDFKDELNINTTTWSNYEKERSYPNLLDFISIAAFFNVSETSILHEDLASKIIEEPQHDYSLIEKEKAIPENMNAYIKRFDDVVKDLRDDKKTLLDEVKFLRSLIQGNKQITG